MLHWGSLTEIIIPCPSLSSLLSLHKCSKIKLKLWGNHLLGQLPRSCWAVLILLIMTSSLWSLQKGQVQKKDLKYCFILIASEERKKKPKKIPRSTADKSSEKSLGSTLILMWHVTRQICVCPSPESCCGFCEVTGTSGKGAAEKVPSLPPNRSVTAPRPPGLERV